MSTALDLLRELVALDPTHLHDTHDQCRYCGQHGQHDPECLWMRAREFDLSIVKAEAWVRRMAGTPIDKRPPLAPLVAWCEKHEVAPWPLVSAWYSEAELREAQDRWAETTDSPLELRGPGVEESE